MKVLFVIDPVAGIDPTGDTTAALMEATESAGHELWVTELRHLEATPAPAAVARRIRVSPWCALGEAERLEVADLDAVFIRSDPPFDGCYLWAMHILDLVDRRRVMMINDPDAIRSANEKLYALRFPELIPPTLVTADRKAIEEFVADCGTAVIKPVDGHAGRGVLRMRRDDPNLPSIAELQTGRGQRPAVVQAFVDPGRGNHRIFMVDGEATAVVNRIPQEGDFRTGDVVEVLELSRQERHLCNQVAPVLVRDRLRFVGLDVIADRLIEVNVTSPGGLRQLERLSGRPYARPVVDRLLSHVFHPLEVTA